MKSRLILLLSGVALLAAMPAWADTYVSGLSVESGKYELIATPRTDFELGPLNNEGVRDAHLASPERSGSFISATSNSDVQLDNAMKLDPYRGGTGEIPKVGSESNSVAAVVPEPESLSLFVLGLAALGSIALRRR